MVFRRGIIVLFSHLQHQSHLLIARVSWARNARAQRKQAVPNSYFSGNQSVIAGFDTSTRRRSNDIVTIRTVHRDLFVTVDANSYSTYVQ